MRFVDVPMAELCCFVLVGAGMNAQGNLAVLQGIGKSQVGRGIVDGIHAHDDQQVYFAGSHVGD